MPTGCPQEPLRGSGDVVEPAGATGVLTQGGLAQVGLEAADDVRLVVGRGVDAGLAVRVVILEGTLLEILLREVDVMLLQVGDVVHALAGLVGVLLGGRVIQRAGVARTVERDVGQGLGVVVVPATGRVGVPHPVIEVLARGEDRPDT